MKKDKVKVPKKQKLIEFMFKGRIEKLVKNYRLQVVKEIFDDLESDLSKCLISSYGEFVDFILQHRNKQVTINALEQVKECDIDA